MARVFSIEWRFFGPDGEDLDSFGNPLFASGGGVGGGSAWSVLTNGDAGSPEIMWDSNGDVIMTELCGGAICS